MVYAADPPAGARPGDRLSILPWFLSLLLVASSWFVLPACCSCWHGWFCHATDPPAGNMRPGDRLSMLSCLPACYLLLVVLPARRDLFPVSCSRASSWLVRDSSCFVFPACSRVRVPVLVVLFPSRVASWERLPCRVIMSRYDLMSSCVL